MNKRGIRILIIAAVAAILYGVVSLSGPSAVERAQKGTVSVPATKEYTYVSDEYNFSVLVPAGWSVFEKKEGPSAIITLYKNDGQSAPETYSDTTTHVSILPTGSETGGILPWKSQVSRAKQENATTTEYVLKDGTVWAKKLEFAPVPASWQSWGFVFAVSEVSNLDEQCVSGGKVIPVRECDPLSGDTLVRDGKVRDSDMRILETILGSFSVL